MFILFLSTSLFCQGFRNGSRILFTVYVRNVQSLFDHKKKLLIIPASYCNPSAKFYRKTLRRSSSLKASIQEDVLNTVSVNSVILFGKCTQKPILLFQVLNLVFSFCSRKPELSHRFKYPVAETYINIGSYGNIEFITWTMNEPIKWFEINYLEGCYGTNH
jgi:hypothetical protein